MGPTHCSAYLLTAVESHNRFQALEPINHIYNIESSTIISCQDEDACGNFELPLNPDSVGFWLKYIIGDLEPRRSKLPQANIFRDLTYRSGYKLEKGQIKEPLQPRALLDGPVDAGRLIFTLKESRHEGDLVVQGESRFDYPLREVIPFKAPGIFITENYFSTLDGLEISLINDDSPGILDLSCDPNSSLSVFTLNHTKDMPRIAIEIVRDGDAKSNTFRMVRIGETYVTSRNNLAWSRSPQLEEGINLSIGFDGATALINQSLSNNDRPSDIYGFTDFRLSPSLPVWGVSFEIEGQTYWISDFEIEIDRKMNRMMINVEVDAYPPKLIDKQVSGSLSFETGIYGGPYRIVQFIMPAAKLLQLPSNYRGGNSIDSKKLGLRYYDDPVEKPKVMLISGDSEF